MSVDAVHLILSGQVLPAIRAAVADLGGDEPGTLVHARPTPEGSRWPTNSAAADARGDLAHPTGTAFDVDASRRAGTLTAEWVVGHILHDLATHTGHLELTRDVLLDRGRSR